MAKRLGFIGAGNMGGAILRGIIADGQMSAGRISVYDKNQGRLDELQNEIPGIVCTPNAQELTKTCDMIIIAVKPNMIQLVIDQIRPVLMNKAIVSIAAGWTTDMLDKALEGTGCTWLRVMPNTPVTVREGMTAICDETTFTREDFEFAKSIFDSVGRTVVLPEQLMDGVIAVSGSSPAYVYMMIEAMGDAAVLEGIPRAKAYEMAAQAVMGAALMVLQTNEHPGTLKDAVCSPGGTTIAAVASLERSGFRSAVIDAMHICAEKSAEMSKRQ